MKISIITVTYNRSLQTLRGLRSILNQTFPVNHDIEAILIDDGSTDNTREVSEQLANEFREKKNIPLRYFYLDHPEPRISCIPRNYGIRQADGEIIIFTEPEALHVGNTIFQLFLAITLHKNNSILASQVWTMGEKIYKELSEEYFEKPYMIVDHPWARIVSGNMQNIAAPNADYAITGEKHCNAGVLFATRKKWLEKVGGFDESFFGHGHDDFDLFNRLALTGHGLLKRPNIAVIHQWHEKNFYPYNIYECAEKNGKISEANIHKGIYKVNDENWGLLPIEKKD